MLKIPVHSHMYWELMMYYQLKSIHLLNSEFWPEDWKCSVNEKFICCKIQYNTRDKIFSNCTCKILLNTCSDYLLEMRWGKSLLNTPAWKWTEHSDVGLSYWPIFTNSLNYLDVILLILKIQSIPPHYS